MSLHRQTTGSGPHIVLLHGWGLHSGVWDELAAALVANYTVIQVDLPGHGRSSTTVSLDELDGVCSELHNTLPASAIWLGWSLGGLIAQAYALHYPYAVKKLILVASTPCFVQAADWPHAIKPDVLEMFANNLQNDYRATLKRFLALQLQGGENSQATLRQLRETMLAHPPQPDSLRAGLDVLRNTDLRGELTHLACPLRLILGERDMLVPKAAGPAINKIMPDVKYEIIKGAAHAPFLSHQKLFNELLTHYLND